MYPLSRILQRNGRYNFAPSSFGAVSKLETSSGGDKERAFKSSGLIYNKSQGLIRLYSTRDVFSRFFGIQELSSIADAKDKGDEEVMKEELCKTEVALGVTGDVTEGADDDSLFESELGSDVDAYGDDLEIEVEHSNDGKGTKKRARPELFESIVAYKSVKHVLEVWVKEGKDLSQAEVSLAIHHLRKRRSYALCLQLWEWLRANTQFEFSEENYASQLDLVAKVHSLQKAENFLKDIPESFRGEVVYRTLLANCVLKSHVNKAEVIFNKMRELKFPPSLFACNQLLLLYSKHDRKKIPDVLSLMERENIKPSRTTYQFLINSKGLAGDITGMEKIVETMKEECIEPNPELQASLASYYIRAGLKERAEEVMKEIEGKGLKQTPWVCCSLLSHFAALMEIYTGNKMLAKGKDLVKRMGNYGIKIGPSSWHALVKLYTKAGEVGKAELILDRATKDNKMRPLFISYMVVLEEYAKRGDVHNTEKVFMKMKRASYTAQLLQYETVISAYLNAKTTAYGITERMKADNVFPNKNLAAKLAQVDPFKMSPVSVLLDE